MGCTRLFEFRRSALDQLGITRHRSGRLKRCAISAARSALLAPCDDDAIDRPSASSAGLAGRDHPTDVVLAARSAPPRPQVRKPGPRAVPSPADCRTGWAPIRRQASLRYGITHTSAAARKVSRSSSATRSTKVTFGRLASTCICLIGRSRCPSRTAGNGYPALSRSKRAASNTMTGSCVKPRLPERPTTKRGGPIGDRDCPACPAERRETGCPVRDEIASFRGIISPYCTEAELLGIAPDHDNRAQRAKHQRVQPAHGLCQQATCGLSNPLITSTSG